MATRSEIRTSNALTEKTCTKCGEWRPADTDHFAAFRQGALGLHPWCRDCHRQYSRDKAAKTGKPVRKIMALAGAPPKVQKPIASNVSQLLDAMTLGLDEQARYKAYLITNRLTGENYVGITERKLRDRWKQHVVGGISGTGYLLHKVMQRDGIDNFSFEFIACAIDRSTLHKLEVQLIDQYRSVELGYNQTRGGASGEAVGTEITLAGRTFISISSAAREFGVDEDTAFQRLHRHGWTADQAFGLALPPKRTGRITNYKFGGRSFDSFVAACKAHGLEDSTVRRRIGIGWTERQAFNIDGPPTRVATGNSVSVAGQLFKSITQAAQHFGVRRKPAAKMMADGMTPEQAFGLAPKAKRQYLGKSVTVDGKAYRSLVVAAKSYGVDARQAGEHLRKGWTTEQAFGLAPPKPRSEVTTGNAITLEGVTYTSHAKAAQTLGLDPRIVHSRLKQFGWTMAQAFGLEDPPVKRSNSSKMVTVNGQNFPTIADACMAFGIAHSTVNRRITAGMSLEAAIAKPPQKAK